MRSTQKKGPRTRGLQLTRQRADAEAFAKAVVAQLAARRSAGAQLFEAVQTAVIEQQGQS